MKQILMLGLILLMSLSMRAQNAIEKHFQPYQEQDNFTSIHVTAKMFELASYIELEDADPEVEDFLEFVKTMTNFDMVVGQEVENITQEYDRAVRKVSREYEELMNVEDTDGTFTFYINESKGIVHELVMVGKGKEELMIFSLSGTMDLRQISKIADMIKTEEYRQMGKLSDYNVGEVNVYPNPARQNSQLTIELPEEMLGGTATIFTVNGASVRTMSLNNKQLRMKTSGLSSGLHILELKKNGVSIKKKLMIQ